ncbi:hypothetical protein KPH14_001262, partial [Odynerus spinipes]
MSLAHSSIRTTTNNQHGEELDEGRNTEEEWARLRREREKIEQLRAELEKTRTASVRERAGPRSKTRKNVDKGNKAVGDNAIEAERRVVSEFINHMQHLQVDVKIDKFSDENKKNPIELD